MSKSPFSSATKRGKASPKKAPLPTPPKSGKASLAVSKRSSPRSGSQPDSSPLIPAISPSTMTSKTSSPSSATKRGSNKKKSPVRCPSLPGSPLKKGGKGGFDEVDMLCPICDDVCTCIGVIGVDSTAWASGTSSVLASPIISGGVIRNAEVTLKKSQQKKALSKKNNAAKKQQAMNTVSSKKQKDRLDQKIDQAAQYLISDFYFRFPEDYYDEDNHSYDDDEQSCDDQVSGNEYADDDFDSDSSLDALMFEISEDDSQAEMLLINKVNSVIGPSAWLRKDEGTGSSQDDEDDDDGFYIFDPVDAANLVVNLPLQVVKSEEQPQHNHISNLTPQVLAAISAATKTLNAANQHYSQNPDLPFSRESSKQVQFMVSPVAVPQPLPGDMVALEELLDTSCLHGSSPPQPTFMPTAKRWEKIPINAYRKRRLSVPKVLPHNAFKSPPPNYHDMTVCQPMPDSSFEAIGRRSTLPVFTSAYETLPKRTNSVVQGLVDEIEELSLDPKACAGSASSSGDDVFDGAPSWFNGDDSYLLGEHWRSLSLDIDLEL